MSETLVTRLRAGLDATHDIKRELGGGGMSHVFLAEERSLGRDVVIKVLPPSLGAGVSAERFAREIRVAARLQQANIVPVLSAGISDGVPYYTMPFVAGESLRDLLRRTPSLPIAQTVAIATDVARALSYAHENGVVHRDIKPENILLSGATAVVTDFGVAKAITAARAGGNDRPEGDGPSDPEVTNLTLLGTSLGTPAYMAPEQALGDPTTDHRADIYALGVTMYEMIAGQYPFDARTPHELMAAHITEQPAPIESRRPNVPRGLASLVTSCLAKDRAQRPRNAAAVLDALACIDLNTTTPADDLPSLRRRPRALVIGACVAVIAGTAATIYAMRDGIASPLDLDVARVLVASAAVDSHDPVLATTAAQAVDLVARTVESLPSVRRVEVATGVRDAEAARSRANKLGAG